MAKGPEQPKGEIPTAFDLSKIKDALDPSKLMGEMSNALHKLQVPGLDVDAVVAAQKRNVEALTNANRAVFEGFQAVARKQAQVLQETMNQASQAMQQLSQGASPPDLVARQTDLAKAAFERAIATMRELAEIVAKSRHEVSSIINARIAASYDEIRDMVQKAKK